MSSCDCVFRRKQTQRHRELSSSAIYQYIEGGAFPIPEPLVTRTPNWLKSDLDDWIIVLVKIIRNGSRRDYAHGWLLMHLQWPGGVAWRRPLPRPRSLIRCGWDSPYST
jgi:predicted DNA-binding transcriptional regulator AlpA